MKKIIPIILFFAIAFSFTACTPTIKATATDEYDVYPNTDWGMTKDEVITALNLNEDDCFEVDDLNPNGSYGFSIEQKQFGYDARVDFWFGDEYSESLTNIGLIMVIIKFDDTTIDADTIKPEILKEFEEMDKIHSYDESIRIEKTSSNPSQISFSSILTADTIKDEQHREKAIVALENISHGMKFNLNPLTNVIISQDTSDTNQVSIRYDGLFVAVTNSVK